ncbi:hypothetical protein KDW_39030 [Dictyobacter vulcani]|uniref:Uncharacterized protein n=1 Tax=Dictyobacter vulcani TaxID=2607529 RepID=A0A5J4KTF0_9CHLR|nr:hypothetical protein [Dictyobacter vulcani]GER89741.1 hypothetical protein KDW_39030 [Dictyobacter vulcani]
MDATTLILTALGAGAAAGGQALVTDAIKDSYAGLKALIQSKFTGKPKAELALTEHESDPETWKIPLKKALIEEQVDQDQDVIKAAQEIMKLIQPQQAAMGKYNLQVTGNVYGYAQGDNQHVNMNFWDKSKEE